MNVLRRSYASALLVLIPALSFAACGGDSAPVTATSMTASSGNILTGTVGEALLVEVIVTGSNEKPFAGGVVFFSVTSGGGSVSPSQANTDINGRASTTWTLGTSSGSQTLSASLEAAATQFTATAQAGPPTSIESTSSFPGQFLPGIPLTQPAAFEVRDQFNNPAPGVSVSFQATNGGTANPTQGTTASDGRVSTTWTLGLVNGVQTLSAAVTGVPDADVTAEAFDPCLEIRDYSIGETATGLLTTESCEIEFDNEVRFADIYEVNITNTGAYRFSITSSFLNPFLLLFDPGAVAGEAANVGTDVSLNVFLDDGGSTKKYFPWIASDAGGVGNYTFTSQTTTPAMTECEPWASTKSLSTTQGVSPEDCVITFQGENHFADILTVWLDAGETLVVTQSSTFFDTLLWLMEELSPNNYLILASNDDFGGTSNSRLDYTASASGFYHIAPTTFVAGAFGGYSMTLSSSGGSGSPGALGPSQNLPMQLLPTPSGERSKHRNLTATSGMRVQKKR